MIFRKAAIWKGRFLEVSRLLMVALFTCAESSFEKRPLNCSVSPDKKSAFASFLNAIAKSVRCPVRPIALEEQKYIMRFDVISMINLA